ncbi:acid protease [Fomitiporia mediterranea MF3/22]|uniref:acid protease n=1 Tax=Fomitiporia mediterranea (strain MF3/22) TaxID=694068 RepID=UPI0004407729|nr:acid protease [Fomitiporia mediterranea MF3/22]EJC98295.1 acid protease [Fomitiporia mediterranea MF3/22]
MKLVLLAVTILKKHVTLWKNKVKLKSSFICKKKIEFNTGYINKCRQPAHKSSTAGKPQPSATTLMTLCVFNNYTRAWVNVRFGTNPKSDPATLLFDSGSSMTCISEEIYEKICTAKGASQGTDCCKEVSIEYSCIEGIKGKLQRNTFTIGNMTIEDQEFALLDKHEYKKLRTSLEIYFEGIIGFGRTMDKCVIGDKDYKVVSVLDNLMQKQGGNHSTIGLNLKIPLNNKDKVVSEVHIGGYTQSSEVTWIPKGNWNYDNPLSFDMGISYQTRPITSRMYPTFTDTGSPFITLPKHILENYIKTVESMSNNKIKFEYDANFALYHISKENYDRLKDAELNFDGRNKTLPKHILFIPSSRLKRWVPNITEERLYLILQADFYETAFDYIVLGLSWMWRYYLIADIENWRVGIAEVKGKTDYIWKELCHE